MLAAERDNRNKLNTKYNTGVNIIGVIDNCLGVTAIGLGITRVGLLSTIVAAPAIIGIDAASIVMGLLRVAKGTFSFWIPLKHIYGFCENYDKIVYGLKHSLTLVRKTDDDAICRAAATNAGRVSLYKMFSFVPHVIPADAEKFSIYKTIEAKVKLPAEYRTRQCDMLSVPESTSFTHGVWAWKQLRRNRDLLFFVSKRIKKAIKLKIHPLSIMWI